MTNLKRKELAPSSLHYILACKIHDIRNIIREQRAVTDRLEHQLAECLRMIRDGEPDLLTQWETDK